MAVLKRKKKVKNGKSEDNRFVELYDATPNFVGKNKKLNNVLGSTERGDVIWCSAREQVAVVITDMSEQLFVQPLDSVGNDQWMTFKKNCKFLEKTGK